MADNTFTNGSANLLWNDAGNWDLGHVPTAGENVKLATYVVAVNVATVPATGVLGTISASGVGQLTFDLTAGNYTFNCTTITPGTVGAGGFMVANGAAPAATLTINCTEVLPSATTQTRNIFNNSTGIVNVNASTKLLGGAATNTIAVANNSTGKVYVVTPLCQAGSGTTATACTNVSTGELHVTADSIIGGTGANGVAGVHNISTGPLNIIAPAGGTIITGGTSTNGMSPGVYSTLAAPTFNNTSGPINLVDGTNNLAYAGRTITWSVTPPITQYWQMGATMWVPALAADQIKKDVVSGGGVNEITGSLSPTHGML